jgi:hypothetical protein
MSDEELIKAKQEWSAHFEDLNVLHKITSQRATFAAMAMQGMLAGDHAIDAKTVAKWSVETADALIEELKKLPR